jgi:hypothetical protein
MSTIDIIVVIINKKCNNSFIINKNLSFYQLYVLDILFICFNIKYRLILKKKSGKNKRETSFF